LEEEFLFTAQDVGYTTHGKGEREKGRRGDGEKGRRGDWEKKM
jgi:hypothetical protein